MQAAVDADQTDVTAIILIADEFMMAVWNEVYTCVDGQGATSPMRERVYFGRIDTLVSQHFASKIVSRYVGNPNPQR